MDKSSLPKQNTDYSLVEYWDERYETEDSYEWLQSEVKFTELLSDLLSKTDRILMLGCGNSQLSEDLYKEGYINITNIDYSEICINKMASKCKHCPHMKWEVMDMKRLQCANETFDVVVEKATLDPLLVGEKDPWNLSSEGKENMDTVLSEVSRVLTPEGRFLSMTFAQPHFRRPLYARSKFNWSVKYKTYGEMFHYFLYMMQKGQRLCADDLEKELSKNCGETEEKRTMAVLEDQNDENYLLNIDIS